MHSYSLGDLNSRLFLPQRDEAIRDELLDAWSRTRGPRCIVFCRSIDHAERMAQLLAEVPQWAGAEAIHGELPRRDRQMRLIAFREGRIPIMTAVDVLNEGVDVPDVNILCFARVTHSRRIFVQQLGRGLRLSDGKERVEVLDFVSDLRRVAAVMNIRQQVAADEQETLNLPSKTTIGFEDQRVESLMEQWIEDAASLETAYDDSRLQFPDPHLVG
jgi:superfamily II DNA or RNA helicase